MRAYVCGAFDSTAKAVEMFLRSAAAYGGFHPSDIIADDLVRAVEAELPGDTAVVKAVLEAAWAVRCEAEEGSHYPPQDVGHQYGHLWYGGGRSQSHLWWDGPGILFVEVRVCALDHDDSRDVPATAEAVALNWHERLVPWAGQSKAPSPSAWGCENPLPYKDRPRAVVVRDNAAYIRDSGQVPGPEYDLTAEEAAEVVLYDAAMAAWDAAYAAAQQAFVDGWTWADGIEVRVTPDNVPEDYQREALKMVGVQ